MGLLGLAALFALVAVYYDRIASITGPGGIGITLTAQQGASKAVARRVRHRAEEHVRAVSPSGRQPAMSRLAKMAVDSEGSPQNDVLKNAQDAAEQQSQATFLTLDYANVLLRLARTSPDSLRAVASAWEIPNAEWPQAMSGVISDELWDRLADRALDKVASKIR